MVSCFGHSVMSKKPGKCGMIGVPCRMTELSVKSKIRVNQIYPNRAFPNLFYPPSFQSILSNRNHLRWLLLNRELNNLAVNASAAYFRGKFYECHFPIRIFAERYCFIRNNAVIKLNRWDIYQNHMDNTKADTHCALRESGIREIKKRDLIPE